MDSINKTKNLPKRHQDAAEWLCNEISDLVDEAIKEM